MKTARRTIERALRNLSEDARRVRALVVAEIGRTGEPIGPQSVASQTGLGLERVTGILDDLERRLMYLYRDDRGDVVWAYPFTAHRTPHHLAFESGDRSWGA